MDNDIIKKIEEAKGFEDIGKMAALVYKGALEESGDVSVAHVATSAFFAGMFIAAKETDDGTEAS